MRICKSTEYAKEVYDSWLEKLKTYEIYGDGFLIWTNTFKGMQEINHNA